MVPLHMIFFSIFFFFDFYAAQDWQGYVKFYVVPLAGGPNQLARYVASLDRFYGANFVSDSWRDAIAEKPPPPPLPALTNAAAAAAAAAAAGAAAQASAALAGDQSGQNAAETAQSPAAKMDVQEIIVIHPQSSSSVLSLSLPRSRIGLDALHRRLRVDSFILIGPSRPTQCRQLGGANLILSSRFR